MFDNTTSVPARPDRSIPREMTQRDIHRVIRYSGQAASRCRQGGLDGLETLAGANAVRLFDGFEETKKGCSK